MRCEGCSAGWLSRVPPPGNMKNYYAGEYYTPNPPPPCYMGSSEIVRFLRSAILSVYKSYGHLQPRSLFSRLVGTAAGAVPAVRRRASFDLGEMAPSFPSGGQLLEIGCDSGAHLALMRMLGWSVYGIEPDPAAARVAAETAGCAVHVGTVEDAILEPESVDAIVCSHVIEHVPHPASFVYTASRFLRKGGVFVVRTPNLQSLGHRLFGPDWFSLDPPRHMVLFTPASMRRLFKHSGVFSSIKLTTTTDGSRLAIHRRYAARKTGSFLGHPRLSMWEQGSGHAFAWLAVLGNAAADWGEEIYCVARKR